MASAKHLTTEELERGLHGISQSPKDGGALEMIVRRRGVGEREVLDNGELDLSEGLVGDTWKTRGHPRTADGAPDPEAQLTIMNSRVIALVAREKARWPLAGDQLYLDMDLSLDNLPPGTRVAIGTAIVEVTAQPHTGCRKFLARFGPDAMNFVNSPLGRRLHLRGINTRVVQPGVIRVGDIARKLQTERVSS